MHGCAAVRKAAAPCASRLATVAQVHGPVSREPAQWTAVAVEEGQLTEVIYEKANGEGIAKARRGGAALFAVSQALTRGAADHHQPPGATQRLHAAHRRAAREPLVSVSLGR